MKSEELGPSFLAAFARVPDVRSRHGRRYPLVALLALATAALMAEARSLYAISQWGRLQPSGVRRALGFPDLETPAATTVYYAFKRLDTGRFEAALQAWAAQALGLADQQVVLYGNALRDIHGEELPGVRLVAVSAPEVGLVLVPGRGVWAREAQAETTEALEEAKQEAELSATSRLLRQVAGLLQGRVVSGVALYCQKAL
jgi:hypothetical protein